MNEQRPIPRRAFLGAAAATSATLVLATAALPTRATAIPLGTRAMTDSPNASPDGTTIPSASSITDNGGHVWTVSNGVIYRDGGTVGDTYNVSVLLWYGGMVYHCGTGGQWYVVLGSIWRPCSDPRIPLSAPAGLMYGVNVHYNTALTPAAVAAAMGGLGASVLRVNTGGSAGTIGAAAAIAQAVHAAGLTTMPVIDAGLRDSNNQLAYSSETEAYSALHTIGANVATAMAPYGVTMYECGNELTRDGYIILPGEVGDAGTKAIDFDNTNWPLMRGVMRGLIDGVKSVQPSALCGINFCRSDVGASDALWDGMQPDGTGHHPTVRWDLTTWHNYEGDGDIFHIGTDGAGPSFNLPIYVKARYGKPFLMTEWNCGDTQTLDHRAAYIPVQLEEFRTARTTVGFESGMFFELDGGTAWGLTQADGTPLDPPYTAYQSYVTAHPDAVASLAPIGSTVSFKAYNGLYASTRVNADGTRPVQAVATVVGTWEKFTVIDAGGGAFALRSLAEGKYVSAWKDTTGGPLLALVTAIGDWEKFRWVITGAGSAGILSLATGEFVSARDTSGNPLMALAPRLQGWETFQWATV